MTIRDDLQNRLVQLAADAAAAKYFHLASLLYFVAGAFAASRDAELADVVSRWNALNDRRN